MKILMILSLLPLSSGLFAQDKAVGRYRDYFGSRIQLTTDKTFKYTWNFDQSSSWTKGTWAQKGDTIYFRMVPIYDTLSHQKSSGMNGDTLILSTDEIPERISPEQSAGTALSSGGQNRMVYPEKLVFKKGRLYKVVNGNLITKKQKGILSDKKWNPWFFKTDD